MSTFRRKSFRSRRGDFGGYALIAVILVFVGGGISAALLTETLNTYKNEPQKREEQSSQATQDAKISLLNYLLLRTENSLGITEGAVKSVKPRLLMLPCPDNIGEENLDGTQDPTCGAKNKDGKKVNHILNSGSRFGRLPWRVASQVSDSKKGTRVSNSIHDGLGKDFLDGYGNRLWYALAKNMAPTKGKKGLPLNFHRLATMENNWLSIVNERGQTLSAKTAAVILSPGRSIGETRKSEEALSSGKFKYPNDVTGTNSALSPEKYFESVSVTGKVYSNHNTDGVFVQALRSEKFNDVLSYIDLHEMMNPDGFFYNGYIKLAGVADAHNAPRNARPLANIRDALSAYRSMFGFYPTPAKNLTTHLNERQRHCATYDSGTTAQTATLPAGITLLAVAATAMSTTSILSTTTVALTTSAAFLLADNAGFASFTLATYSRITLSAAVFSVAVSMTATSFGGLLPAGEEAVLVSAATASIPPKTPLAPAGHLFGWLPEHNAPFRRANARDGNKITLLADTRAGFLSKALLITNSVTITVAAGDIVTLLANTTIKFEEQFKDLKTPLSGELHPADGASTLLLNALPTSPTYKQRQFVVRLLTDFNSGTISVLAPAVLYPWREKSDKGDADSRDNLHPYPPCFDSRNFYNRKFRTFIEDQPIFYTVADSCHYGGGRESCGRDGGLTVHIGAGAVVALPRPTTLTHSFTVTSVFNGVATSVVVNDGIADKNLTMASRAEVALLAGGQTAALARFPVGSSFTVGAPVALPAGALITGVDNARLENVEALLVYSPAPLSRVNCTMGMTMAAPMTVAPLTLTLSSQQTETANITPLCYWLDDWENIDGDGSYWMRPPVSRGAALRNDYFLLFGGDLHTGP